AFLAAFARPFLRSQSTAASMSPCVSPSAALQSIIPAPVFSRRSLTIEALMFAIAINPRTRFCSRSQRASRPPPYAPEPKRGLFGLGGERLCLRDPAVDTARQSHFLADIVRRLGVEAGDLPVMEDPEVVELLLDRGRHAGELGEVVGNAARA